jgi:hypothetical protein
MDGCGRVVVWWGRMLPDLWQWITSISRLAANESAGFAVDLAFLRGRSL